jgi:hypothetical protein
MIVPMENEVNGIGQLGSALFVNASCVNLGPGDALRLLLVSLFRITPPDCLGMHGDYKRIKAAYLLVHGPRAFPFLLEVLEGQLVAPAERLPPAQCVSMKDVVVSCH